MRSQLTRRVRHDRDLVGREASLAQGASRRVERARGIGPHQLGERG